MYCAAPGAPINSKYQYICDAFAFLCCWAAFKAPTRNVQKFTIIFNDYGPPSRPLRSPFPRPAAASLSLSLSLSLSTPRLYPIGERNPVWEQGSADRAAAGTAQIRNLCAHQARSVPSRAARGRGERTNDRRHAQLPQGSFKNFRGFCCGRPIGRLGQVWAHTSSCFLFH